MLALRILLWKRAKLDRLCSLYFLFCNHQFCYLGITHAFQARLNSCPNHTTGTMRMHTELRIVVMQRTSTCLPNMDESQLLFYFDLSNDINKVMSYIWKVVPFRSLCFDGRLCQELDVFDASTRTSTSKHIDVSCDSPTWTLSRLLASYTRNIFSKPCSNGQRILNIRLSEPMQEGSKGKDYVQGFEEFLEEC